MQIENTTDAKQHPYESLDPDRIIRAVESTGLVCDGTLVALNSYENRVYQVGIEADKPVVAKFYRPGRWSEAAILEEHAFCAQLAELDIPFVTPMLSSAKQSLQSFEDFWFALYPRCGGHWPELDSVEKLQWMGRLIGRIHNVGSMQPFVNRPALDIDTFGIASYRFLLDKQFIPMELETPYRKLAEQAIAQIQEIFAQIGTVTQLRLHGDCHPGNVLWTDDGPHFVDLDDCRSGPAVQDLWMLLAGDREEMTLQLSAVLEGYTKFKEFDPRELHLIEPLRTLRLMHYSAWLARRWEDPAFPKNFPWFNSYSYWQEQCMVLEEQLNLMRQPPLAWIQL